MHKKRYESLKVLFQETELAINDYQANLMELQLSLADANKEIDQKQRMAEWLVTELNKLERQKHAWDIEKRILLNN